MPWRRGLVIVLAVWAGTPTAAPAGAQETSVAAVDAGLRKTVESYHALLARGDDEGWGAIWTPTADYVDQKGRATKVKDQLALAKTAANDAPRAAPAKIVIRDYRLRQVTPDVAIEDGVSERSPPAAGQSAFARYTAVWTRQDGKWLVDGVRESALEVADQQNRLQGLAWLVGRWSAEGDGLRVDVTCTWGPGERFLLREMKVAGDGAGEPLSATQWIGWDPLHHRIKSFVYDSQGGFSEGVWTREGDAWVVTAAGALPDGQRTTATNLYTPLGDDAILWESVDDEVNGNLGRDFRLQLTRQAAPR